MLMETDRRIDKQEMIPEHGELVEIRRCQWGTTQINSCRFAKNIRALQHLVTLENIDEDALGAGIQVIGEHEPSVHVLEKAGLPDIDGHDPRYTISEPTRIEILRRLAKLNHQCWQEEQES